MAGDPSLFRPFDVEVAKAFEQFAVPLPPDSWLQARLPLRRGGLGLRRAADHAAVAAVASAIGTSAQAPALGHLFALEDDPLAARALLNLPVATVSGLSASVDEARRLAGYVPHLQRQFSAIVDEAASSELLASLDQAALARLSSASGKHASGWLACIPPPDGSFADMWLAPQDFLVAVRLRLGLPLDDVPHPCVLCKGKFEADTAGQHSLCCMGGGARSLLHSTLKQAVVRLASAALFGPRVETQPFASDPGARVDVDCSVGSERHLIDVAVVFPLQDSFVAAAAREPGGAATSYQQRKVQRYEHLLADVPSAKLVPVVIDTFGAFGESALAWISRAAVLWGRRFGIHPSRAVPLAFQRINVAVMRAVAQLLQKNITDRREW